MALTRVCVSNSLTLLYVTVLYVPHSLDSGLEQTCQERMFKRVQLEGLEE